MDVSSDRDIEVNAVLTTMFVENRAGLSETQLEDTMLGEISQTQKERHGTTHLYAISRAVRFIVKLPEAAGRWKWGVSV